MLIDLMPELGVGIQLSQGLLAQSALMLVPDPAPPATGSGPVPVTAKVEIHTPLGVFACKPLPFADAQAKYGAVARKINGH